VLALTVVLAGGLTPARAADGDELVIDGGGWGHGIGMPQYGAYGQALEGKTAEEITGYYYSGSSTAQIVDQVGSSSWMVSDSDPLWVNLLPSQSSFTFRALGGPLTVCHTGSGGCDYTADPGEQWEFATLGDGTCQFLADGTPATEPAQCKGAIRGMSPGGSHVEIDGLDAAEDEFARGTVRIRSPNDGDSFHVVIQLGLEKYLYGLAEVPFSWHSEALQAQALAGRSYAVTRMLARLPEAQFSESRRVVCWCHMYATTADQNYGGWANEAAPLAERWINAVDETAGTVITHPDASQANIVAAFYSSSTGGATENNEDIWGGTPVSYLRSKEDPWSQAEAVNNPFDNWEYSFTEDELAARYGVDKIHGVEIRDRFQSGTPSTVKIYARSDGDDSTIVTSGLEMYTVLDLRGRNVSRIDYGNVASVGGDFTGDGRADVASLLRFNQAWWTGSSTPGKFVESMWFNHGSSKPLEDLVSGDFNGDGRADVAGMQSVTGRLLVGLSTGSRFKMSPWVNHADPTKWGPLLVGDFDGDGADDIAEYQNRKDRWRVYRLVQGEPVRQVWYDFSVQNPNWSAFAVADFNGDELDDILSVDGNTGGLIVLFSDGSTFTPAPWESLPDAGPWEAVQAADFTGDGASDLGAYDPVTGTWWVVAGTAETSGEAPVAWYTFAKPGQDFGAMVAGDIDDDGRADVTTYTRGNGKLKVLMSDGTGFDKSLWGKIRARKRIETLLALDVDGDGDTDIAAWDNKNRRWWVAEANATSFEVTRWGKLLR